MLPCKGYKYLWVMVGAFIDEVKPTQLRPRPLSEAYPTKTEATEWSLPN